MKHTTGSILMLLLLPMVVAGCRKEDPEEVDLGYGYYPNVVGSWIEYQVDSIGRDDAQGVHDTASYRLKEKVVEAYVDPEGRLAYRIHRMVLNAEDVWVVRDVWTRTKDNFYAEATEENLRRLKMSFPVRDGRAWNMNIYNVEEEVEVAHRQVGVAFSIGGYTFPKTTLVQSTFEPNFVDTLIFQERYADAVGMVYKHVQVTNTQFNGTQGTYLTMALVAYGNE